MWKWGVGTYEGLAILGIITAIAICLIKKSFFFSGTVLGASVIAYILAFILASYGLKRQGLGKARLFYAVAAAATARWFFEIVYHYAFPGSFKDIPQNLANLSTNTSETNFALIWSIMMVLIIFTGYKYMAVGKWFWGTLAFSAVVLLLWVLMGYPQWEHPEKWPYLYPVFGIIPSEYAHAPNQVAIDAISQTSLIMNSIAKIAVCALLPTLFLERLKQKV